MMQIAIKLLVLILLVLSMVLGMLLWNKESEASKETVIQEVVIIALSPEERAYGVMGRENT